MGKLTEIHDKSATQILRDFNDEQDRKKSSTRKPSDKLSGAMRAGLALASKPCCGIAGSDHYSAEALGGRSVARALNRRGLIRMVSDHAGAPYRITPAGRLKAGLAAEAES